MLCLLSSWNALSWLVLLTTDLKLLTADGKCRHTSVFFFEFALLFLISAPFSFGFELIEVSAVPDLICLKDFDGLGIQYTAPFVSNRNLKKARISTIRYPKISNRFRTIKNSISFVP
jgi:hypothetical protein